MPHIKTILKLIRIEQWYKNILVLIPLTFATAEELLTLPHMGLAFLGFCGISSITYIINDWMDREKDRLHPTKKHRPLASGKIGPKGALLIGGLLAIGVITIAFTLGGFYSSVIGTYFIITNLYSFGLKNIPILDILIIGGNFVLRMMGGFNTWPDAPSLLFFGVIFGMIALFTTYKRNADRELMGEKAIAHKPVLKFYTKQRIWIIRTLIFIPILGGYYFLIQDGLPWEKAIVSIAWLMLTSFLFEKEPKLAIKPHHLFKNPIFDAATIGMLFFMAY